MSTAAPTKWNSRYAFEAYAAALQGKQDQEIAVELSMSKSLFCRWKTKHPLLGKAVRLGRTRFERRIRQQKESPTGEDPLFDYVSFRLSKSDRAIWEQVSLFARKKNAQQRLNELFALKGPELRKRFFMFAMLKKNFNVQRSCELVGICPDTVDVWCKNDPAFVRSVERILECKREFFENALIEKVAQGDTRAILFANESQNKHATRWHGGYGKNDPLTIDHLHSGSVRQDVRFNLAELDLPIETRKTILEAIRAKKLDERILSPPALEDLRDA